MGPDKILYRVYGTPRHEGEGVEIYVLADAAWKAVRRYEEIAANLEEEPGTIYCEMLCKWSEVQVYDC